MEMEMELKTYADECVRLRHTLEKVMESKDPLSDPNEIAQIEEQFQKQEMLLQGAKQENAELAAAYQQREEELGQWQAKALELDKKAKKAVSTKKDTVEKYKKASKEKDKELNRLK